MCPATSLQLSAVLRVSRSFQPPTFSSIHIQLRSSRKRLSVLYGGGREGRGKQ